MKKSIRFKTGLTAFIFCFLLFGCVNQQGTFITNPPGAVVIVGDEAKLAPCKFKFPPGTEKAKIHCAANGPELEIKIPQPNTADKRKNIAANCAFYVAATIVGAMFISLAALAAYGGSYEIGPLAEPILLLDINESGFLPTLEEHVDMSKSDCE